MENLASLEQAIGFPPGSDELRITGGNRPAIQAWLTGKGIEATRVESMRDGTLFKAYAKPAYLRAILSRADYTPGAAKPSADPTHIDPPVVFDPVPHPEHPAPAMREPALIPDPTLPNAFIPTDDKLAQLGALIASLAGASLNEARVISLIREHAPRPDERVIERIVIERATGEKIALPDQPRHEAFADILAAVMADIPVMLVGPAGAGKTTLGHQIASALALAFSHTGAVASRYELSGYNDAHGNYQGTAFRQAYQHGGLFLFDEIDGSDPAALLWCNTAIANGVCAFPDGNVDRHPDFRLIACANTYGKGADRVYVGRNQLDGASLDRFCVVDFDYDERLERAVFGDNDWTNRVQSVRRAVASFNGTIRHVVSPRATLYGAKLLAGGMAQHRVEAITLWKGLRPEDCAKIMAAVS